MTVHHRVRTLTFNVVLVTAIACSLSGPAAARENKSPVRRVRSIDPSIAALIEQSITRSPTFNRLVATVEASNGIVHVQSGRCRGGGVACLPIWMTSRGGNRCIRSLVNRERIENEVELLSAISHELQQAIEVLRDHFLTTNTNMYFFNRMYATIKRERFVTPTATT